MPVPHATPHLDVRHDHIEALTSLRGVAALMVVLVHVASRTDYPWLGLHAFGPILLFVLSGFLLYRPFGRWALGLGGRPSLRSYAIRRGARIFPAFWVVLLLWMVVYPPAIPMTPFDWITTVSLVSTLNYFGLTPGMEQTWTMGTELTWYVVVPLLALGAHALFSRLPPRESFRGHAGMLLCSLTVSPVWALYAHVEGLSHAVMWLPTYLFCFTFGALAALALEAERAGVVDLSLVRRISADPWLLPAWLVVLAWLAASEWAGPDGLAELTVTQELLRHISTFGAAAVLLLICLLSGPQRPVLKVLKGAWLQALGRWSYGIYLWHLPVIVLLWEEASLPDGPLGLFLWLSIVVAASTLLGAATYEWVEKPAIAWSHRRSAPRPSARVVPAQSPPVEQALSATAGVLVGTGRRRTS